MEIIKNERKEQETVAIKIYLKKKDAIVNGRSIKFIQYHTYLNMIDKNTKEELKAKWVQVKFTRDMNPNDLNQIKGYGIITCNKDDVNFPSKYYEVKKDDKTGKDIYPTVWIHNVLKYEPLKTPLDESMISTDDDFKAKNKNNSSVSVDEPNTDSFDI